MFSDVAAFGGRIRAVSDVPLPYDGTDDTVDGSGGTDTVDVGTGNDTCTNVEAGPC